MNISELSINTLKINGVAAINKANSGHPGIVLSASKMVYTLFTRHLNFDPKHVDWINRDRFILSAGHGSALLYAQLRILKLINEDDLKNFRQLDSITPGHPEYLHTRGVEATTGPLGQGISIAVGIAISQSHLESKFPEINHHTYVLCGDGDLQEGVANEALSLAGRLQLNKLIILHDSNDIQLDTEVKKTFNENLKMKFTALNYNYIRVENNVKDIDNAIKSAKKSLKPTFIEIKTIIGEGSPNAGTTKVHGAPLGKDIDKLKETLNWNIDDFEVPLEVQKHYEDTIFKNGALKYKLFKASPELKKYLKVSNIKINITPSENVATRISSGEAIAWLNKNVPQFIGGSADLSGSTKALGADGDFDINNRKGRNINFGVREFAMGGIANGIALHSKLKVFVSTFFVFSDYLKPSIRLAALMHLPVIYLFSHDSILIGEDGPTHQPVEHTAMLRSIPNVSLIRPADEKEMIAAWEYAINKEENPTIILATRQNITSFGKTKHKVEPYYVLKNNSKWNLISNGSELYLSFLIAKELNLNLISAPDIMQNKLQYNVNHSISIEAGTTFGWSRFAKFNIGIDNFGFSAPINDIIKKIHFDKDGIMKNIIKIIKSNS